MKGLVVKIKDWLKDSNWKYISQEYFSHLFFLLLIQNTYLPYLTYLCVKKIFNVNNCNFIFQINFNGHVTFGAAHDKFDTFSVNATSSSVTAIFNVFFSDNDIRRPDGAFYHRLSSTVSDRSAADAIIRGRGFTTFSSSYCLIVTWEKVKYYVSDASRRDLPQFQQENTYQEILCTDGNEGHVIYHYQDMQWTKSEDPSTNPATVSPHME